MGVAIATTYFERTVYHGRGYKARSRVEYITKTGQYATTTEARVEHQGMVLSTGMDRADVVCWEAENLPAWAEGSAVKFFVAAEASESAKWVAYTEWRFSLPRELTRAQQLDAARALLGAAFGTAHAYVWAMHDPRAADGGRQPHVHVLWNARIKDGLERSPAQFFRRWNATQPERGGARKNPALNEHGAVKVARILYTDVMNLHLEQAGQTARLHPERLTTRGIEYRTQEPRLSVKDSDALKYEGRVTPRMQRVLEHRAARQPFVVKERNEAREYWEQRKIMVGLTRDMPMGEQVGKLRAFRQDPAFPSPQRVHPRHAPGPVQERASALRQKLRGLALDSYEPEGEEPHGYGRRLRVRLHEDERGY